MTALIALAGVLAVFVACGDDGFDPDATSTPRAIGAGAVARPAAVEVWLGDYGILSWRTRLASEGTYTFIVSNRGGEPHNLAIVRWAGALDTLPARAGRVLLSNLEVVARTDVIPPGTEVDVRAELTPGRYALVSSHGGDFGAGMATTLTVQSDADPRAVEPVAAPPRSSDLVALYVTEHAIFRTRDFSIGEEVTIRVQNVGRRPHDLAIVQWRGDPAALPVLDGRILLDGLNVLATIEALAPGEERTVEVRLPKELTYAIVSTREGEYEAGMVTTLEVR